MPYVVTRPARIGEEVRQPGFVLSDELLAGRNIRWMEAQHLIAWHDNTSTVRRPRRQAVEDE